MIPPSVLCQIQSYLDEQFTENITLIDISTRFFYSREHLARMFKKYLNTSITEYITERRIRYSCQLMKTDATLTDICYQSGFNSHSSFIRAFKRITGVTPSSYRKNFCQVPPAIQQKSGIQ